MALYTLALDTSGQTASVALFYEGNLISDIWFHYNNTHSERFMDMVDTALKQHQISIRDLGRLVVISGPGSYTGLRIALATAKALSQPYQIPIYPVSTLDVLGYQQRPYNGVVLALMDARNKQIYGAGYSLQNDEIKEIIPKSAYHLDDFIQRIPMGEEILLCGDGAAIHQSAVVACFKGRVRLAPMDRRVQRASAAALLTFSENYTASPVDSHGLSADYLRQSQAERERQKRE